MGLFFYNKIGSIISIVDLPTTNIIEPSFFNDVEAAYEGKVEAKKLLDSYKGFKAVVPSKSEEKRLGREFETVSGYSLYRAVQAAKEKGEGKISLGK
ncbi:UPF0223 family protein [Streptococcus pneumoniae]